MTEDDYIDIQSMLRACDFYFSDGTKSVIPEIAADFIDRSVNRIEKLEAVLRVYACEGTCPNCYGAVQDTRYCGWTARKALETNNA